jgi:hypothetical protein
VDLRQSVARPATLVQHFRLLFAGELGPRAINFYTARKFRERDFEPNRQTRLFSEGTVFRIEEGSAPKRNDGFRRGRNTFQAKAFDLPEVSLAIFTKDIGDRAMFAALDFFIEIDEFPAEFLRQAPADRGFTGTHEANQINASNCHPDPIVAAGCEADTNIVD